ncbi:MAG: hypothetical protein KY464_15780, partial [Gemmatimonadetes bacterium]|nr:hypothetical protein [Gemmatimonadota bacterium]
MRAVLGMLALAASLPLAACETDEVLSVTDPDIINPEELQTAEGAEGLRLGALSRFIGTTSGTNSAPPSGTFFETLFVWSGLLADEWQTGDTFAQRL